MSKQLRTLVIEDSEVDALLLLQHLRHGGYDPHYRRVDNPADLADALAKEKWDVVFSDHNMPGFSSRDALKMVRASNADVPFLIVSGSIGEETAVAAMREGAQDYLMKEKLGRLVAAMERELKDAEDRKARRDAERTLLAREEELRIAREVQQQLFPAASPVIPGYDIAGASRPAEATGGDYFDFIFSPHGTLFLVVGDVTGHGIGAALLMADVRAYLRALVLSQSNPETIISQVRHLLAEDLGSDRFITMLCARLAPDGGELSYINAGHPTGHVFSRDGKPTTELGATAPALGIENGIEFSKAEGLRLAPGELVLFVTDGILEASSPTDEEFGERRVLELVAREYMRPSAEIIRMLFDEVTRFSGQVSVQDDITAVIIKRAPGK